MRTAHSVWLKLCWRRKTATDSANGLRFIGKNGTLTEGKSQRIIMETKQERRNRLYRERYKNNENMRERCRLKARAAILERNQKRKDETTARAKERGLVFCGNKKYNINTLILESYEQERRQIIRLNTDSMFWQTYEGQKYIAECAGDKMRLKAKAAYRSMTLEQKKQKQAYLKKVRTPEKQREYNKRYKEKQLKENPIKFLEKRKQYKAAERHNPLNRAKSNMRNRFRGALKHYRQTQRNRMSTMIGCTWAFFDQWIASQFKRGMKWENYGRVWHIDHIEPLAHFDITDQNDMKRAWHYSNLRPLKAAENIKKGAKIVTCQPELLITIV